MKFRNAIFFMTRDHTMVNDASGWMISIGPLTVARFGPEWREKYWTTWMVAWRQVPWFYSPTRLP